MMKRASHSERCICVRAYVRVRESACVPVCAYARLLERLRIRNQQSQVLPATLTNPIIRDINLT